MTPEEVYEPARDAQRALARANSYLELEPPPGTADNYNCVRTWHLTLGTLAAEITDASLEANRSGVLRAARILNRCLLEYACRAHYYHRAPDRAATDMELAQNMSRKIMHPARNVKGDMSDADFTAFQRYMNAGGLEVTHPQVHVMMRDLLRNFDLSSSDVRKFMRWLDVEYTVGSGLAHGSQVAVLDAFVKINGNVERLKRSKHFSKASEARRTALCVLAFVAAVEMHNTQDFGTRSLLAKHRRTLRGDSKTSIWQHDALNSLL